MSDALRTGLMRLRSDNGSRVALFYGDSGTGKTTAARILALEVNCTAASSESVPCLECAACRSILDGSSIDVHEINAADARGIDDVRRIREDMLLAPMLSKYKVYILDECHALTKDAQNSLLKVLEDAPRSVYIILCSTDPQKLIKTVLNRCQKIQFKPLSRQDILRLVEEVCLAEGITEANPDVLGAVADKASGSPRNALVYLQQLAQASALSLPLSEVTDIISVIQDFEPAAIDICRAVFSGKSWSETAALFSACSVSPEAVRLAILGYGRALLLGAASVSRASLFAGLMELFIQPFYDIKPENSLILALYKANRFYDSNKQRNR